MRRGRLLFAKISRNKDTSPQNERKKERKRGGGIMDVYGSLNVALISGRASLTSSRWTTQNFTAQVCHTANPNKRGDTLIVTA